MPAFLPTTFLPTLPRTQFTLHPLDPREIVAHTAVLRELYMPPVHGGIQASDTFYDEDHDDDDDDDGQDEGVTGGPNIEHEAQLKEKEKQRRFSKGLADSLDTLALRQSNRFGFGSSSSSSFKTGSPGAGAEDGDRTPIARTPGTATPIPINGSRVSHQPYGSVPGSGPEDEDADDSGGSSSSEEDSDDEEEEEETPHLDPFEREWAQKWLQGVVRRSQLWLEQIGEELAPGEVDTNGYGTKEVEGVLRDATAVLAVMAGTGAAGSLTRHLLFPIAPYLEKGLSAIQPAISLAAASSASNAGQSTDNAQQSENIAYSPETRTFLASLTRSRPRSDTIASTSTFSPGSPTTSTISSRSNATGTTSRSRSSKGGRQRRERSGAADGSQGGAEEGEGQRGHRRRRRRRRPPVIPVLLHDAPISDHLSVGVQTWGSAILLGRQLALRPDKFGLLPRASTSASASASTAPPTAPSSSSSPWRGTRVLELGAGTGLLSILSRKLLALHSAASAGTDTHIDKSDRTRTRTRSGSRNLVLATDFLPSVLDNLKICLDLNFPAANTLPLTLTSSHSSSKEELETEKGGREGAGGAGGVEVAKLDWATFPSFARRWYAARGVKVPVDDNWSERMSEGNDGIGGSGTKYPLEREEGSTRTIARPTDSVVGEAASDSYTTMGNGDSSLQLDDEDNHRDYTGDDDNDNANPMAEYMDEPFDLVIASDCVYDPTHAEMIRKVAGWILRPPEQGVEGDIGGTLHILSPLRPTFAPELESIDRFFPVLSTYPALSERERSGEGLGYERGLRIGTRGTGKRSVKGKKGEGRVDEGGGYWWWEVGWG